MAVLQPKKSYKLNYIAIVPPVMAILSEIGVWMPILNVFSIFLGIMGMIFGTLYIIKIKKSTKKKVSEFALIALGNMLWIVAMVVCAVMKFSSATYADSTSNDFINQLIGIGYVDRDNEPEAENKKASTNATGVATQISKNYKLNETAESEGLKVTLTDVRKNFEMDGEYSKPRPGSQFVKVSVKIENSSNSEVNVSESDVKIKESQGAIETPTSLTDILDDRFESALLTPGGIREGAVIFEVPEDDDELKVIYTFPTAGGERAEFDI